jgi:uncharacterized membrane protein
MYLQIYNNHTHARFVEHLKQSLGELAADIDVALSIVCEHISSFDPRPMALQQLIEYANRVLGYLKGVCFRSDSIDDDADVTATAGQPGAALDTADEGLGLGLGADYRSAPTSRKGSILRANSSCISRNISADDGEDPALVGMLHRRSSSITDADDVIDLVRHNSEGTLTKQRRRLYSNADALSRRGSHDEHDVSNNDNNNTGNISTYNAGRPSQDLETGTLSGATTPGSAVGNIPVLHREASYVTGAGDGDKICLMDALSSRKREFELTTERLVKWRSQLLNAYKVTRMEYVWRRQAPLGRPANAVPNKHPGRADIAGNKVLFTQSSPEESPEQLGPVDADPLVQEAEAHAAAVRRENQRHSWKNLFPRGAYLHRVVALTDLICALDAVLDAKELPPFSPFSFLLTNFKTVALYLYGMGLVFVDTVIFWSTVLSAVLCAVFQQQERSTRESDNANASSSEQLMRPHTHRHTTSDDETVFKKARRRWRETVRTYAQPCKIALAICVTALFALVDQMRGQIFVDGVWATVAIGFIRQENVSSSFLVGYQRLEGTAIGALYSFVTYQGLHCDRKECGLNVTLPVIVVWVAVCAFWRNGARHGYAAIVAAFTPMVLFLGSNSSNGTLSMAWKRVAETIVGVGIYLIVDNCILPRR